MSWYQLTAILQEARELYREELQRRAHPVACKFDGEPLLNGGPGGGVLYCPYCGWRPGVTGETDAVSD